MARSGPETLLVQRIVKALRECYGPDLFIFKVHGNEFQQAGIPDLVGCVRGRFFGLEVKHPSTGHLLSRIQEVQLERIERAGGITACVWSVTDALRVIAVALDL